MFNIGTRPISVVFARVMLADGIPFFRRLITNQCVEIIHYRHYFCCNGCGAVLVDVVRII